MFDILKEFFFGKTSEKWKPDISIADIKKRKVDVYDRFIWESGDKKDLAEYEELEAKESRRSTDDGLIAEMKIRVFDGLIKSAHEKGEDDLVDFFEEKKKKSIERWNLKYK